MRILLVKSFAHPTSVGALAKGLRARNHEVHVVLPPGPADCDDLRRAGISVHALNIARSGYGLAGRAAGCLQAVVQLSRFVRSRRFDVIHLNLARARLYGRLASLSLPTATVVSTIRGFEVRYERWTNWIDNRTIAVSAAVKKYLVSNGIPETKIVTIPNGIDLVEVDGHDRPRDYLHRALGLDPGVRLIGMVAFFRNHLLKGHKVFFDAAQLISRADHNVRFVVVGSNLSTKGYTQEYFERYVEKLGIRDRVHFLGGRNDILSIMRSLYLHVLPSFREGCPMVVLEAMASETPTIASRIESIAEIIDDGHTGVLVDPGDHQALAAQAIRLLRDQDAARALARSARRRIEASFTTANMVNRYEGVFEELAYCR